MYGEIAQRIGALRKHKGYTLKELSDKTGLSISFLSQVETGVSSLALTSLKKIADALEVPIVHFFSTEPTPTFHSRLDDQKPLRMEASPCEFFRLSGSFASRAMEGILVNLPPMVNLGHKFSHQGEEFVYVLAGLLQVDLDGEQYEIKAGESIHYPSTAIHGWSNLLPEETKLLVVLVPALF